MRARDAYEFRKMLDPMDSRYGIERMDTRDKEKLLKNLCQRNSMSYKTGEFDPKYINDKDIIEQMIDYFRFKKEEYAYYI